MSARKVNPRWINSIALDVEPLIQIAQWHSSNLVADAKTLLSNGAPPAEVQSLTSQAVAAANGSADACLRLFKLYEAAAQATGDPDDRDPAGSAEALRRLQAAAGKWAAFSDAAGAASEEAKAVEREAIRVSAMSGILAANPNLSFAAGRTFSARLLIEGAAQPEAAAGEADDVEAAADYAGDEGEAVGEEAGAEAGEDDAIEAAAPPPEEPAPAPAPAAARKSRPLAQEAPPSDEIVRAAALVRQALGLPKPKYDSIHTAKSAVDSALPKLELARLMKAFPKLARSGRGVTNLKTLKKQHEDNIAAIEAYLESDSVKTQAAARAKAIAKASLDDGAKAKALSASKALAAADAAYLKAKLAELKDELAAANAKPAAPKPAGRAKGPKGAPAPAAAPAEAEAPPAAEAVAEEPEAAPPVDAAAIAKDLAAGTATTPVRRRKVSAQVGGVSRGVVEK